MHLGDQQGFTAFMRTVDPSHPQISRISVTWYLEEQADEVVKSICCTRPKACAKTDVSFTCDIWSLVENDPSLTITLHWLDEKWDMHTIILGSMAFSV